jgi:hypothetical protein
MSWVQRTGDTTHYATPLFFVQVYELVKQGWIEERRLRLYDSTYTIPLKDSLNLQLWELTKSRGREVELWKPKANPRCGTGCKVLGGAAAGELLRRLISSWTRG